MRSTAQTQACTCTGDVPRAKRERSAFSALLVCTRTCSGFATPQRTPSLLGGVYLSLIFPASASSPHPEAPSPLCSPSPRFSRPAIFSAGCRCLHPGLRRQECLFKDTRRGSAANSASATSTSTSTSTSTPALNPDRWAQFLTESR